MYIIKFKFEKKNITKKAKREIKTFAELIDLVKELFSESVGQFCSINYMDSDKEMITIGSDEEWEVCCEEQLEEATGKLLKITLFIVDDDNKITDFEFGSSKLNESQQWSVVTDSEKSVNKNLTEEEKVAVVEKLVKENSVFGFQYAGKTKAQIQALESEEEITEAMMKKMKWPTSREENDMVVEMIKEAKDWDPVKKAVVVSQMFPKKEEIKEDSFQNELKIEEESDNGVITHIGFTCNGCGVSPIVGVRFHSMETQDFDLCSGCESTSHHEHPMLRFRHNTHIKLGRSIHWKKMKMLLKKVNGDLKPSPKKPTAFGIYTSPKKQLNFTKLAEKKSRRHSINHPIAKNPNFKVTAVKLEKPTSESSNPFAPKNLKKSPKKMVYLGKMDSSLDHQNAWRNIQKGVKGGFETTGNLFKRGFQLTGNIAAKTVKQVGEVSENVVNAFNPGCGKKKEIVRLNGALHPMHSQFKSVFPHVDDRILNEFLRRNAGRTDPMGLWNKAANQFATH